jgi:hypothetical protein
MVIGSVGKGGPLGGSTHSTQRQSAKYAAREARVALMGLYEYNECSAPSSSAKTAAAAAQEEGRGEEGGIVSRNGFLTLFIWFNIGLTWKAVASLCPDTGNWLYPSPLK